MTTMTIMMVTTTTGTTRGKLQPAAVQERCDEKGVGATIEVAVPQERAETMMTEMTATMKTTRRR
jgi:hypothetical protein